MKKEYCVFLFVLVAVLGAAQADTLFIRDGWDIVSNVPDVEGYIGTRDDTGKSDDLSVPTSPSGGTYAGVSELFVCDPFVENAAAVLDFDLSGISQLSNVVVTSAKLKVVFSSAPWFKGGTFAVREADKAWVEDETNYWYYEQGGDVWNLFNMPIEPDPNAWSYGMRMDDPILDTVEFPAENTESGLVGEIMVFDITGLVKGWIENGDVQLGVSISYDSGSLDNMVRIAGKDYGMVEYRPMLEIEYETVACPIEILHIRDGWDIVNDIVADANDGGYSGTKDDTGKANDWSTPASPGGGTYAGATELFVFDPHVAGSAAIIDFDMSSIDQLSGVDVLSAKLKLALSTASWFKGGTFMIREVDKPWVEDEANYWRSNTEGAVWNNWSDGMKMDGPTLATVTLPANNTNPGPVGNVMEFDVTTLVEGWLEDGNEQLGFAISYSSGYLENNFSIAGKDYEIVEYRPMLEIRYSPIQPISDFTDDCFVGFEDLAVLASQWLTGSM